jgi:hypothetical protein
MGANRVEIAFVQGIIAPAEFTSQCALFPRRAAVGAANHGGIVTLRFRDGHHGPATAAKFIARPQFRGIVLPIALVARDKQTHGILKQRIGLAQNQTPSPLGEGRGEGAEK